MAAGRAAHCCGAWLSVKPCPVLPKTFLCPKGWGMSLSLKGVIFLALTHSVLGDLQGLGLSCCWGQGFSDLHGMTRGSQWPHRRWQLKSPSTSRYPRALCDTQGYGIPLGTACVPPCPVTHGGLETN